jgi:hypothetical protein
MKALGSVGAWSCIFSILFAGCYSSAVIDPNGAEKDQIDPDKIQYLVMKDSTIREFVPPLSMSDSAFTHQRGQSVSIPMSTVRQYGPVDDKGTLDLNKLQFVVTKDSLTYKFITPTRVIDEEIVGEAVKDTVTIPLAEVAYVSTRGIDPAATVFGVLGFIALTGVILAAMVAGVASGFMK